MILCTGLIIRWWRLLNWLGRIWHWRMCFCHTSLWPSLHIGINLAQKRFWSDCLKVAWMHLHCNDSHILWFWGGVSFNQAFMTHYVFTQSCVHAQSSLNYVKMHWNCWWLSVSGHVTVVLVITRDSSQLSSLYWVNIIQRLVPLSGIWK